MELYEKIDAVNKNQEQKCVICGRDNCKKKKTEEIEKTVDKPGWSREQSMTGVFATGDSVRKSIYPRSVFPPTYSTSGHHCIAYSSFIKKNKKTKEFEDECATLNHFLNAAQFKANDETNIIQLPNHQGTSCITGSWPADVKFEYQCFWTAIDLGFPLQLHTGKHRKQYFETSDALYKRLMILVSSPKTCEESDDADTYKKKLKEYADDAVNFAFEQIAAAEKTWQCHPENLTFAERCYSNAEPRIRIGVDGSGKEIISARYPGLGRAITYPILDLTVKYF